MQSLGTGQWSSKLTTNSLTDNMINPTAVSSITVGRQTVNEESVADWYNAARLLKALMQRSKLTMIAPSTELEDQYRDLRVCFDNWLYAIASDRSVGECNTLASRYTTLRDMYTTYETIAEK